jgi:hypothetical protein
LTALIIQRENAGGKLILADPHAIGVLLSLVLMLVLMSGGFARSVEAGAHEKMFDIPEPPLKNGGGYGKI